MKIRGSRADGRREEIHTEVDRLWTALRTSFALPGVRSTGGVRLRLDGWAFLYTGWVTVEGPIQACDPQGWVFGYQADPMDPSTGQVDMGARWYEPSLGRFDSRDPLLGDAADPLSLNQYVYGQDSPLTYSDPTGEMPMCQTCTPEEQQDAVQHWGQALSAHTAMSAELQKTSPRWVSQVTYLDQVVRRLYSWNGTYGAHRRVVEALVDRCPGGFLGFGGHMCLPEVSLGPGGRADMVDFTAKEIFEVKPDKAYWLGPAARQVARYVAAANNADPVGGWSPGRGFAPFQTDYLGRVLIVRWAAPGVVMYRPECAPDCGPDFDLDTATLWYRIKTNPLVRLIMWMPEVVRLVPVP